MSDCQPKLESLEPRQLLAMIAWDGGGNGTSWHDALNWSTNTVPTQNDDATIQIAGSEPIIKLQDAYGSVRNLLTSENLEVLGSGFLDVFGDVTLQNANLILGGTSINNNPTGQMRFTGSQAGQLNGTGAVELSGARSGVFVDNWYAPQRTLTIGSGITIRMTSGAEGFVRVTDLSQGGRIINHGAIEAASLGGLFTVGGYGNSANIEDDFISDGVLTVSEGSTLKVGGQWSSSTALNAENGDLILGGYFSASTLDRVVRTGIGNTRIQGSVDVSANGMQLNATTGSMLLESGSIIGPGAINTADGTQLSFSGGLLWDVTLAGEFIQKQSTLRTRGNLAMTSGTLTGTGGTMAPSAGWALDLHVSDGVRFSKASIQGTVSVIDNGAALWIDSGLASAAVRLIGQNTKVIADGTQTWTSGSIAFENSGEKLWLRDGGSIPTTLTLNNAFVIKGGGGTIEDHPDNTNAATLIAKGILRAEVAGTSLTVNLSGGTTSSGTLQANTGSTLHFASSLIQTAGSIIASGGVISLSPGGNRALRVGSLSILNSGKLDLADHDLVIDYGGISPIGSWNGSTYTGISGLIASGRNAGTWDGSGIATSMSDAATGLTTLGAGEASEVLGLSGSETAMFSGETVDATCVLIKYTYTGDANLNGLIDGTDYFFIDSNVATSAYGYANGDFNYDGVIDGSDYFFIDGNSTGQGPTL